MKLKQCPFCGIDNARYEVSLDRARKDVHYVRCAYCGAEGPSRSSIEKARAAWNKRINEDKNE